MDQSSTSQSASAVVDLEFTAFYEREIAGQIRSATLMLSSSLAAEDVVHDTFAEVFKNWGGIAEPGPYLQRAVLNRCRDLMRRNEVARRYRRQLRIVDVPEIDVPLYDALAKLPFKHRAAVVLRYYLQLTESEIADCMDCPTGSVGPWIRRGLDRLTRELHQPEEGR